MRPEPPVPLAAPVIDSHCHLDVVRYGADEDALPVDEALRLAAAANVTRVVQIGCDLTGARWAVEAADTYDGLVAGVALHPNEIPDLLARGALDDALTEIERLANASDRVRAIGETGLDHFRTPEDGWKGQEDAFRAHIELAKRHGKALVIHDRDAHEDVLRVLADEGAPDRVVMHCFSGDAVMARECVARGYHLSFAGTVTFKNATDLRAALVETPVDRILVETDAPYLTPTPHRGQTNASYLIPLTVRAMAAARELPEEALCAAISATTVSVLGDW